MTKSQLNSQSGSKAWLLRHEEASLNPELHKFKIQMWFAFLHSMIDRPPLFRRESPKKMLLRPPALLSYIRAVRGLGALLRVLETVP